MHRFLKSVPSPVKRRRLDEEHNAPPTAEQHSFLDKGKKRDWAAVKSMLASCPRLINVQPLGRWTVLHQAAEAGSEDTVAFLLKQGADVKVKTKEGKSPLQVACTEAVRALLTAAEEAASTVRVPRTTQEFVTFVWQVQPEALSGKWVDMGKERQALLNDAKTAGVGKAMFREGGHSYIVDLDRCTQSDFATGSICPIRLQSCFVGDSGTHCAADQSGAESAAKEMLASPTPVAASLASGKAHTAELAPGQSVEVPGSGEKSYTVKNCGGGVWSCTCISWKMQGKNPANHRTCKHIQSIRGVQAEQERGASVVATVTPSKKTVGADVPHCELDGTKAPPPLLYANKWEERVEPTGWWISEKLDGMRAFWDPAKRCLLSRLGNPILCPKPLLAALPDVALDGELFLGRGRFQELMSVVKNSANIGLAGGPWKEVVYMVFDLPKHDGKFEERMKTLRALLDERAVDSSHSFVRFHEQQLCKGRAHLDEELKRVQADGGEGLMLRRAGSSYEAGRSSSLLKVKTFQDEEAVVLGYEPGKGRNSKVVGALRCRNRAGIEFSVGTGLSDAQRADPPKVGEIITYRFFELTKDNKPRFPSYVGVRADADPTGLKL
mmetsp:Transcript_12404/g.23276  ORF Transcript_12404/g.23276 Transcript_12404/m.23276 type:complete len:609 (-) Transcript_12404:37-1863(-)